MLKQVQHDGAHVTLNLFQGLLHTFITSLNATWYKSNLFYTWKMYIIKEYICTGIIS